MKKLLSFLLVFVLVLSFCACSKKKAVTMVAEIYSSGYGIAGDDFNGRSEDRIKNVHEGDCFFMSGNTITKVEDKEMIEQGNWDLKIESIEDDKVEITVVEWDRDEDQNEVTTGKKTVRLDYGQKESIAPNLIVNDMPRFSYCFKFEKQ